MRKERQRHLHITMGDGIYPVLVLGGIVVSSVSAPNPSPILDKHSAPILRFGEGSGGISTVQCCTGANFCQRHKTAMTIYRRKKTSNGHDHQNSRRIQLPTFVMRTSNSKRASGSEVLSMTVCVGQSPNWPQVVKPKQAKLHPFSPPILFSKTVLPSTSKLYRKTFLPLNTEDLERLTICIVMLLPFVLQCSSHLYSNTFVKVLGVVAAGKLMMNDSQDDGEREFSLRGVAFMAVLTVLAVLETQCRAPCPRPFAGPTM